MIQINVFTKQKQIHRLREPTYGSSPPQRGQSGGDRLGIWDWHVHIAIFKIDNQQGPTFKKFFKKGKMSMTKLLLKINKQ